MSAPRLVLAAAVAAGLSAGVMASRARLPRSVSERWERTNHAGNPVTLLEGPAYAVAATAGCVAAEGVSGGGRGMSGALAALGAGGFGALDDLVGDSLSKGLKGHLGALSRGEVTTGAVKILGLGVTGLAAALIADRHREERSVAASLVGGAAVAGAANVANLLDLRPGRALKATVLVAAPLLLAPTAPGASTAASAVGAALGCAPADLRGKAMLGDTGANAAGALVGLALVERFGLRGRLVVFGATAGLTVLSERVSFSRVIDQNRVLRRIDHWGRG